MYEQRRRRRNGKDALREEDGDWIRDLEKKMEMDPRNGYDRVSSLQKRKLRDRPKKTREQEREKEKEIYF